MKNLLFMLAATLLFTACNNKADQPAGDADTLNGAPLITGWKATLNDSSGRLEMQRTDSTGIDSLTPSSVVAFLNQSNSNVQLQLLKTSNDTIYVSIPEADYLTQQMGSTGAVMCLAGIVYNLTEIPGIRYVNFDFAEGDHATPGTMNRESFKDE